MEANVAAARLKFHAPPRRCGRQKKTRRSKQATEIGELLLRTKTASAKATKETKASF